MVKTLLHLVDFRFCYSWRATDNDLENVNYGSMQNEDKRKNDFPRTPKKIRFLFFFSLFLQNSQYCASTLTQNTKWGGGVGVGGRGKPHQREVPLLFNLAGCVNEFY